MNNYMSAMRRYVDFSGRSSRSEFWFFVLFYFIIAIIATVIDAVVLGSQMAQGVGILSGIVLLVHLIPSIAVSVRRLHDTDRSGWWILICLVPLMHHLADRALLPGEHRIQPLRSPAGIIHSCRHAMA